MIGQWWKWHERAMWLAYLMYSSHHSDTALNLRELLNGTEKSGWSALWIPGAQKRAGYAHLSPELHRESPEVEIGTPTAPCRGL